MPEVEPPARPPGGALNWDRDGRDWPHAAASSFRKTRAGTWHVQRMGEGPVAMLIHGTGASTHSWAGLMPLLAKKFEVLSFDLPGHGFTPETSRLQPDLDALPGTIGDLLEDLGLSPSLVIGHSAGAAVMVRLAACGVTQPSAMVSINGALRPFPGLGSVVAPMMAKALTVGGLAATAFSRAARNRRRVERLLQQTGSSPPAESINAYQALLKRRAHVAGTLAMMANWDLSGIAADCAALTAPILFMAGDRDRAVPPSEATRLAEQAPEGKAVCLDGLGHLAHEEDPETVVSAIDAFLASKDTAFA